MATIPTQTIFMSVRFFIFIRQYYIALSRRGQGVNATISYSRNKNGL